VENVENQTQTTTDKSQMFMESVETANLMTQWLLSILEKDDEYSGEDQD